jgi:phosphoribosylformylglycinamidine cyclo-ligase
MRSSSRIARILAAIAPSLDSGHIKAMAHITGGGITDNLPRVLPQGVAAVIDRTSWEVPAIFAWLAENGRIADAEMSARSTWGSASSS